MTGDRFSDSDPFSDQAAMIQDEREAIVESTLSVGRNATLTLGTDAVIVLGQFHAPPRLQLLTVSQMKDFAQVRDSAASDCCPSVRLHGKR